MLDDMQTGHVRAIVAYSVATLAPRSADLVPFMQAADEYRIELATATGDDDLSTPEGRAFARQLGRFAAQESAMKSQQITSRNAQNAAAGKPWVSGSRCFGYEKDGITPNPAEAAALVQTVDKIIDGETLRSVTTWLNDQHMTTTTGGQWKPSTLRRLLVSPHVSGRRSYGGRLIRGEWAAVIAPDKQDELIRALTGRSTIAAGGNAPRKYLLTGGLLVCGLCGSPLASQPGKNKDRAYVCRVGAGLPGCGGIRIKAEPVEIEAVNRVIARLASPQIHRRLATMLDTPPDFSEDRITGQIKSEEDRLAQLGVDYANRTVDRISYHAASEQIDTRIADLRIKAAGAATLRTLPKDTVEELADWFQDASLDAKHDLVAIVLDHVVVNRATKHGPGGLDKDRLDWYWRV